MTTTSTRFSIREWANVILAGKLDVVVPEIITRCGVGARQSSSYNKNKLKPLQFVNEGKFAGSIIVGKARKY